MKEIQQILWRLRFRIGVTKKALVYTLVVCVVKIGDDELPIVIMIICARVIPVTTNGEWSPTFNRESF